MSLTHKLLLASLIFVTVGFASAYEVEADPISVMLTNPIQTGTPGSTFVFTGSLTNVSSEPISINLASLQLSQSTSVAFLIFSSGIISLSSTESTAVIPLFSVSLDPAFNAPSIINGVFSVGGAPVGGEFGRQNFTIIVEPVPEPATLLLLGTGVAGIAIGMQKRFKNRHKEEHKVTKA